MTLPAGRTTSNGPDFLCIGAQKAGTGWLYEQLRNHPDFWMPPMKELHYFDRLTTSSVSTRSLPFARKEQDRIQIARDRAEDDRDRNFLDRFERLRQQNSADFDEYARLFESKGTLIAGDITPGYSILEDSVIRKIGDRFPSSKIIFIARDPVERAWSQISMYVRRGLIEVFDPDDVDRITEHLQRPEIAMRSYPSQIVQRWRQHANPDLLRVFFFDDLKREPVSLRASIIRFLGGDPAKSSGYLPPDHNTKAEKSKLPLTPAARSHLANFFATNLSVTAWLNVKTRSARWMARLVNPLAMKLR